MIVENLAVSRMFNEKLLTDHFENHFCYRRVNLELSMTNKRYFQTFKDNAQFDFT